MIKFVPMLETDIPQVVAIDQQSFPLPWSFNSYKNELLGNDHAHFFVALNSARWLCWWRSHREVIGYIGYWFIVDEAHISTIAVHPKWRGKGVGESLLKHALRHAQTLGAHLATLEVRVSNLAAQQLYRKYNFVEVGRRLKYYRDNDEDALLMTVEPILLSDVK